MSDTQDRINALERENEILHRRLNDGENACIRLMEERKAAEERLGLARAIVENSPVMLFRRRAGDDPALEYVSDNVRAFGYEPDELLSGTLKFEDIVHPDDAGRVEEEIRRHTDSGSDVYTQEYRVLTRSGQERWITDRTVVVRDEDGRALYHQGILTDITRRRQAEEELRRNEEKLKRILDTAAEGFLLMDLEMRIIDANKALLSMIGYSLEQIRGKTPVEFASPHFKRFLLANWQELTAMEHRRFEGSCLHRDGHHVPVLVQGNILRDENGAPEGHAAFVADISEQKKALRLAEEVQKSLMPDSTPHIPGLDVAGHTLSSAEVGGDYYDFIPGEDGLNVVVGDISGHGVDAALLMTTARALLRMRATSPGSPRRLVSEMNRQLSADLDGSGRFLTLFLVRFSPERDRVTWVRAGHDPALVYCPHCEAFTDLGGSGLPLGIDSDTRFEQNQTELLPGQIIAIGTDGIWEAASPSGEMFGKERFRDVIRNHADLGSKQIVDAVFRAVLRFSGDVRVRDDVTLVVVKNGDRDASQPSEA